jgi:HD superfamily phosphohydrolase
MRVTDSVHGHVRLGPVATDLIDTPAFQRLRHIKQLSTVRLVYPSANHTRFEHSLGVYHLACAAVEELGIDADTAVHVRAAAMLHDVGHGPYGHQTEGIIRRRTGRDHDEVAWLVTDPDRAVSGVLERHGLDPPRVASLIAGEEAVGPLVSGELDVDRMDYLVRDAHHTGVPYGTVDTGRLVSALRITASDELVLAEGNVATAESLLLARSLMNAVVYRHHVSRVAGAMLERACERYLDRAPIDASRFRRLADHELLVGLCEHVPALGRRIERRDLYKRAVWVGIDHVPAGTVEATRSDECAAEREIAGAVGINRDQVIVDVPPRPTVKGSGAAVVAGGETQQLDDASTLVGGLQAAEYERWRLGVYCPSDHATAVRSAAETVLGLENRS